MEETDDSHILITIIDSIGEPEETKRFDKTNYHAGKWIQVGYLNTGAKNACNILGESDAIDHLLLEKVASPTRSEVSISLKRSKYRL